MNKGTSPIRLSDMQKKCLAALARDSKPHGEMCLPFRVIEDATGIERKDVRRSVRALARKGLAEFHSGLCNDDGQFAGAGYCISAMGQDEAVALGCQREPNPWDIGTSWWQFL